MCGGDALLLSHPLQASET
jgi:Leucine-rich repeat (LRR) protein